MTLTSLRYLRQSESSAGGPHGTQPDSCPASNTSLAGPYNSALLDVGKAVSGDFGIALLGESGGILIQLLRASCHLFSNMHEKRMNTGDFSDFYYFNSIKIVSCLVLILALNRHQRHQGSDRAGRTLIRMVHTRRAPCFRPAEARYVLVFETIY